VDRLGQRLARSRGLAWWSLLCAVLAVVTVLLMARAAESGQLFGLYQRLNYGVRCCGWRPWPWCRCQPPQPAAHGHRLTANCWPPGV
jgi:hypothetical protein